PIMPFIKCGEVDQTLLTMIRANVREPDQLVGDIYALATCNDIGARRLHEMMEEFGLRDLSGISDFILKNSREATLRAINALAPGEASGGMRIDGYATEIDLKVKLTVEQSRILSDWTGTSGVDKKGINVPLVYTKAYACYALKCAIAPEIPNNAASLAPFEIAAPENTIVNAVFPAPVALRHVIGHMVPDTVYDALAKLLPGQIPAEGAGCLCNFQLSLRPTGADGTRAEVLTFNSGGSGARPTLDGMSATAFPSGVMTMPVEATEQVGPVIIWRKELRPDSGGAGQQRGGLGQYMDVGAREGHEFDISAMLDRTKHPARGRDGGHDGGATKIARSDGTKMQGKGRQFVPEGHIVQMAFPGGAGFGDASNRDKTLVERDLALGYISSKSARDIYGLTDQEIGEVLAKAAKGDAP
ncbi:MAG: hydantoinase B/oxoprolinase family protein, partial [Pseudomonadota bacterium]